MDYQSILYPDGAVPEPGELADAEAKAGIGELIDRACQDLRWQPARPLFLLPPAGPECVRYRQGVMRDLMQEPGLRPRIERFSESFCALLDDLSAVLAHFAPGAAETLDDASRLALLGCAGRWCREASSLAADLAGFHLHEGLRSFSSYLAGYVASESYRRLVDDVAHTEKLLGYVQYSLLVDEAGMRVRKYQGEPGIAAEALALAEPFSDFASSGQAKEGELEPLDSRIEGAVLAAASDDFGDQFRSLATFCERHSGFADERLARFAWDIRFYLAWLSFVDSAVPEGCSFCLPDVGGTGCAFAAEGCFDATLGLVPGTAVVPAAAALEGSEHVLLVSGRKGSGRSSFARAVAQIFWLASRGLSVPAAAARVPYAERLSVWQEEDSSDAARSLAGMRGALAGAGDGSLLVLDAEMPEGSPEDQARLQELMLDELSARSGVSVVTAGPDGFSVPDRLLAGFACYDFMQDVEDPQARPHRLVRHAPSGLAFAQELACRFGLGRPELEERLGALPGERG